MPLRNIKLPLVIFLGLSLGFVLPQIGLSFKPFLTLFLMALMLFTCLKINLDDFRKIKIKTVLIALFFIFIFMPLLSLGGLLFAPLIFTGILLAFSCPSAAASAFFSDAFKGDSSLALALTAITSLISIVTLPLTMIIGVGTSIKFDATSIVLNLIQIILIPLLVSVLIRKYSKRTCEKMLRYDKAASYTIIIFILWGGLASGVNYIESNIYDFLKINLVVTLLLAVALLVPYAIGKMLGRKVAIALAVTTFVKNAILALVIGSATFGSGVLPPLIANLIDQNILLILLGLFLTR